MCFQNISSFLMACISHFGLREEDLFSPDDLFHASRFDLIILTLSKLSHHKKFIDEKLE